MDNEDLGFPPGTFTSAGYSIQSSQSCHVVSPSLLGVNSGKSLELRLPLIPSQENQQAERGREAEKREKEAEKTKESESSRQTDNITRQGRGKAVALFLCVFTLPFTQP